MVIPSHTSWYQSWHSSQHIHSKDCGFSAKWQIGHTSDCWMASLWFTEAIPSLVTASVLILLLYLYSSTVYCSLTVSNKRKVNQKPKNDKMTGLSLWNSQNGCVCQKTNKHWPSTVVKTPLILHLESSLTFGAKQHLGPAHLYVTQKN